MANSNKDKQNHSQEPQLQLSDKFSLWKMDRLTELGRRLLPSGYWGPDSAHSSGQEYLCLTFDDGPDPQTTPALLDLLGEAGVKATFFLIGSHVERQEQLVARIAAEGHCVGSHSFSHMLMPLLSLKAQEKEIDRTNQRLKDITGKTPVLFRPPFGLLDRRTADCLKEREMTPVYWGAVPEDWEGPGADRVISRVLRRLNHGNLIVLHERAAISRQTVRAAKEIILKGKELGFSFLGIPELMALS